MQKNRYPKIVSRKPMNSLFLGNFRSRFAGKGVEFQDFASYSYGQDARHIDWQRSSAEGDLLMRRYHEDSTTHILAVCDNRESLEYEGGKKGVLMNQTLEFLYEASIASGERFGGYVIGGNENSHIPAQKDRRVMYCFEKGFTQKRRSVETEFSLSFLAQTLKKRSIIFCLSDSMKVDTNSFEKLSLKHDIIYIHLSTSFENTLKGGETKNFVSDKISRMIDLSNSEYTKKYTQLLQEKKDNFATELMKKGIQTLFLTEDSDLTGEFLQLMQRRRNIKFR